MPTDAVVGTGVQCKEHAVADAAGRRRVQPTRVVRRVEVDSDAPVCVAAVAALMHTTSDTVGR